MTVECWWGEFAGRRRRQSPTKRPQEPSARDRGIIELRETMTLEEIGGKFGITRERVRQIIAKHDPAVGQSGKLAVRAMKHAETVRQWTRVCAACGKSFVRRNQHQKYCSHRCAYTNGHLAALKPPIDEQKHRDALAMRAQGFSWSHIGTDVYGFKNSQPGSRANSTVTRWAKRVGYDLSWLKEPRVRAKKDKR